MSTTLSNIYLVASKAVPDMLTDSALVLFMASKPLLDGVYCMGDKEAGLVSSVFSGCTQKTQVKAASIIN